MTFFGFFKRFGRLIKLALVFAEAHGLTDDLVAHALKLVTSAQVDATLTTNTARREWVVTQIHKRTHDPESTARLAVELAVKAYKKQIAG